MSIIDRIKSYFSKSEQRDFNPAQMTPNKAFEIGLDWFGAPASSGEIVTPVSSLGCSAYFSCIKAISEDIAKLPLHVYRVSDDGSGERTPDHYIQDILDYPNVEMGSMQFRETIIAHALGFGGGYAEIQRNAAGKPIALWPLCPKNVLLRRRSNGDLVYQVTLPNAKYIELEPEDVFHIRGLGFDGLTGYVLSAMARDVLGTSLALNKFTGSYFRNGANPSGILMHPNHLGDVALQNLRQSMEQRYNHADNAHKMMILEEGMTYTGTSTNPQNAQLTELKQFNVEEVCRLFRVPPHKIGHLERATFSNIEQQALEYVSDCLMPWAVRVEQEIERKLTNPFAKFDIYAKHEFNSLLRGDSAARGTFYTSMLGNGVYSINEVRREEELPPIENGDEHFVPANWISLERALEPPPPVLGMPPAPAVPASGAPDDDLTNSPTDANGGENVQQSEGKNQNEFEALTEGQRSSLKILIVDALNRTLRVERKRLEAGKEICEASAITNILRAPIRAAASMFKRDDGESLLAEAVKIHCNGSASGKSLDPDAWMARAYSEAENILSAMEKK